MTKEHGATENENRPDSRPGSGPEDLPRHPAARPRAEADRELVPPDVNSDGESPGDRATAR